MISDVAADLRGMLPPSVGVAVVRHSVVLTMDGGAARLSAAAADALLRRLPPIPGEASEEMIRGVLPPVQPRIRAALRRLRAP